MKWLARGVFVPGVFLFASFISAAAFAGGTPRICVEGNAITVQADERVLLRYCYRDVPFKPYIQQLFSPGGTNILRDAPADHQHHHGLMFAVAVDSVNFWEEHQTPGRQVHQSFTEVRIDKHDDVPLGNFTENIDWVNPRSHELLLRERRTIEVCALKDVQVTLLTWQSSFDVPPEKEFVTLTGSHYFGLGMRFVESMDSRGQFSNADGKSGDVVRGDERLVRSKWCTYTAGVNSQAVTVAMFDHPQNSRPVTWFTMTKPFAYLSATMNLHKEPLKVTAGEPLVLKYGVALWDGQVQTEQIDKLYVRWVDWIGKTGDKLK